MTISWIFRKFSGSGSGLCGNLPVGSQYNSIISSTHSAFRSLGITTHPTELTQSTTILNFFCLIFSGFTNSKSIIF